MPASFGDYHRHWNMLTAICSGHDKRQHGLRAAFYAPLVPLPCLALPGHASPRQALPEIADTPPAPLVPLPCLAPPGHARPSLALPQIADTPPAPLVPLPSRATPGQAEPRPAMPSQSAPVRVLNYRIFISSAMRLARSISACRSFGILPRVVLVTLFVAVLAARLCSLTAAAIRRW